MPERGEMPSDREEDEDHHFMMRILHDEVLGCNSRPIQYCIPSQVFQLCLLNCHNEHYNNNQDLQAVVNLKEHYEYKFSQTLKYFDELITVKLKQIKQNGECCSIFMIYIKCAGYDFNNLVHFFPPVKLSSSLPSLICVAAKNYRHKQKAVVLDLKQMLLYNTKPIFDDGKYDKLIIEPLKRDKSTSWTAKTTLLSLTKYISKAEIDLIVQSIQRLTDWLEEIKSKDKIELYNHIMKLPSEEFDDDDAVPPRLLELHMKYRAEEEQGKDNQYAYAVVITEACNEPVTRFGPFYPDFKNKKHSEEILIEELEPFLEKNKVKEVSIYTYNSPCLQREENTDPCMLQLLVKAWEWNINYGLITRVCYTKFWGLAGPKYFNGLTFSSRDFYPNFEECQTPFKLDHKELRYKKIDRRSVTGDKQKLQKNIDSARHELKTLAKSSDGLYKEHFDRGKQKIASFTFLSEEHDQVCRMLLEEWDEMVKKCLMTTEFNRKIVQVFRKRLGRAFQGNFCPLLLYHIPHVDPQIDTH